MSKAVKAETSERQITVRGLQTKDIFTVARIIRGCTSSARDSLTQAVTLNNEDGEAQTVNVETQDLGFAIFEAAVDQEDEIKGLFADLAGMKPDEFEQTEYDTVLVILEEVAEHNDLPGFFERALALGKKISTNSST